MKLQLTLILFVYFSLGASAQHKNAVKNVVKPDKIIIKVEGEEFKILRTDKNSRKITIADFLFVNLLGVLASNDSVLFNTYNSQPFDMPANEPTFNGFLVRLKQGDSAVFSVLADSLFPLSFGKEVPTGISNNDRINCTITVLEVATNAERMSMQEDAIRKQEESSKQLIVKDSMESARFLKSFKEVKVTPDGLKYIVVKSGIGRQVVKGDKITVSYKGKFLDGRIFDESKAGEPAFTFQIGSAQVIRGWEEGLLFMKEGDQFKFIIPWDLAYGLSGQGPIPPYTTLVFDIKLDKID
ncbi:MAG: FKBP-type peptidyl-prolyl cis-trans isomerase [Bacteroidia bacterium]|nr:FKBP-type peptidyl-prolyl cis-trans isomerase [Bacteroidia bacterium]